MTYEGNDLIRTQRYCVGGISAHLALKLASLNLAEESQQGLLKKITHKDPLDVFEFVKSHLGLVSGKQTRRGH